MKHFVYTCLFGLICAFPASGQHFTKMNKRQKRSFPYYILATENGFKQNNIPLYRLGPLRPTDQIQLRSGFLLLVHHTGQLMEFSGDTTFLVSDLKEPLGDLWPSTDFSFLFSENSRFPIPPEGAVICRYPADIDIIFPYEASTKTVDNQALCFWWKTQEGIESSGQFKITLKNIYDEVLAEHLTDSLLIEVAIPENTDQYGGLIIASIDDQQKSASSNDYGMKVVSHASNITPCSANNSIEYLKVAIDLERDFRDKEALIFYEKAAGNSHHSFYQEVYELAVKRIEY